MSQNPTPEVFASNEIVSAIVSNNFSAADLKGLETDPKSFLMANGNLDLQTEAKFNLVENSNDTINLALPYYSEVKAMAAVELTAEQMEEIAGGEIIALIIAACATVGGAIAGGAAIGIPATLAVGGAAIAAGAVGTAAAAAGAATGIAYGVRRSQGKNLNGSIIRKGDK